MNTVSKCSSCSPRNKLSMEALITPTDSSCDVAILPFSLLTLWNTQRERVEWLRDQCQMHLLHLMEQSLNICGLVYDAESPANAQVSRDCLYPPNLVDEDQNTLLHAAFKYLQKDKELNSYIWALISNGADTNQPDANFKTPLMLSVEIGLNKGIELLSSHDKCDLAMQDSDGNTSLMLAIKSNNMDAVKILVRNAIKRDKFSQFVVVDNDGLTPEDVAKKHGQKEMVNMLHTKRIRFLKTITAQLKSGPAISPRTSKQEMTESFYEMVFGVVAANRWRRRVQNRDTNIRRSKSAMDMAHLGTDLRDNIDFAHRSHSPSPSGFRKSMKRTDSSKDLETKESVKKTRAQLPWVKRFRKSARNSLRRLRSARIRTTSCIRANKNDLHDTSEEQWRTFVTALSVIPFTTAKRFFVSTSTGRNPRESSLGLTLEPTVNAEQVCVMNCT